ncbi:MAG: hypothetical protein JEZ11_03875 [Desulfobacterales bacterium]|nr:hypothetical protein [Desulfobacterales bacterium]
MGITVNNNHIIEGKNMKTTQNASEKVRDVIGIEITEAQSRVRPSYKGGSERVYFMRVNGQHVELVGGDSLLVQAKFRKNIAEQTDIWLPELSRAKWSEVSELLFAIVRGE